MKRIDLHTHSTASDGTLSPRELVRAAADAGLSALALTDHDTVDGLPEALAAGEEFGVEVIPGCELSCESDAGWMHIVGLWLPEHPSGLVEAFKWVLEGRKNRNHDIVAKLNELGIDVTYEEIAELAGGVIGRPHFARILHQKGVVETVQEAFDVYLGTGGKAYIPKRKLSPERALGLLKAEGATAVLAHPFMLEMTVDQLEAKLRELMDHGLDGIEVFYTEHTPEQVEKYGRLAEKLGLLVSGGSDFHGEVKPHISLGRGRGELDIPYELVERMKASRRDQGLPV